MGLKIEFKMSFLMVLAKNWRFAPNFARLASLAGLFASLTILSTRVLWYR